jgi:hypothetical protein
MLNVARNTVAGPEERGYLLVFSWCSLPDDGGGREITRSHMDTQPSISWGGYLSLT